MYSRADPEGGQEVLTTPPPLKNHKNIMFLSNTGPEPLKNHKATKPAFNVGPPSAHQRNAIYMAISGWLMMARFYCYLDPLSPHTKKKQKRKRNLS